MRIYSQDVGIELGIEKCAMLIMRSGKKTIDRRNRTSNQEKIRTLGELGNLQVLGNIGIGHHQTSGDERKKIKKEYLRAKKLLETKLYNRNFIKEINTWAVPLVRYSGLFIRWTRDKLQQMDQRTGKLMRMHKTLHRRNDINRRHH